MMVLLVPVDATTTLAAAMPGMTFEYWSLAVMVTVVPVPPAVMLEGAMASVDVAAETAAGVMVRA